MYVYIYVYYISFFLFCSLFKIYVVSLIANKSIIFPSSIPFNTLRSIPHPSLHSPFPFHPFFFPPSRFFPLYPFLIESNSRNHLKWKRKKRKTLQPHKKKPNNVFGQINWLFESNLKKVTRKCAKYKNKRMLKKNLFVVNHVLLCKIGTVWKIWQNYFICWNFWDFYHASAPNFLSIWPSWP